MPQSDDAGTMALLNCEAWRALLRSNYGGAVEVTAPGVVADEKPTPASADPDMQLAVYDLVDALFAPSDPPPVSRAADKLIARIAGAIKDGFADSDFGPVEVAAKAGISLCYVQRLLTERGATCGELIYSYRLDRAAHLLYRRALFGADQPFSEIATSGLAIRGVPVPEKTAVTVLCALVQESVRPGHATFNFGHRK